MTTFSDRFATRALPKLTEQFGSTVTYIPLSGASRDITARVSVRRDFREQGGNLLAVEILELKCSRDANGILCPKIGDGIKRGAEIDQDQRPFVYTGVSRDAIDSTWTLVFSRDVIFRQGGSEQTGTR